MKYTLIGVRTLIQNQESYSFGSADMTQYTVFLKGEDKQIYTILFSNNYGDCMSGWTSATWGDMTDATLHVGSIGTLHYVPKDYTLQVEVVKAWSRKEDSWQSYDGLRILDTDIMVAYSSGDGGDSYYPGGGSNLNMDYFNPTPRLVAKRKLFVFTGPSCVGKSFLASHINLKAYETDSSNTLPASLDEYDIVVIGGKHKHLTTEVVTAAIPTDNVDIVHVSFTPQPSV